MKKLKNTESAQLWSQKIKLTRFNFSWVSTLDAEDAIVGDELFVASEKCNPEGVRLVNMEIFVAVVSKM